MNKLKEKSANFLNTLKVDGTLDSKTYNKLLDFYAELIEEAYEGAYDVGYEDGYDKGWSWY